MTCNQAIKGADAHRERDMTNSAVQQDVIRFSVPLPPVSLRANSRAHWGRKKDDADCYAFEVYERSRSLGKLPPASEIRNSPQRIPWQRARVTYTWRHAGVAPDHSNLGGHTKYLQDIICMAPKSAPMTYSRWHLGLIENDSGIEAVFKMEKVAHRKDECVEVCIESLGL